MQFTLRFVRWNAVIVVAGASLASVFVAVSIAVFGGGLLRKPPATDALLSVANALAPVHFLPEEYGRRISGIEGVKAVTGQSSAAARLPGARTLQPVLIVDAEPMPRVFDTSKLQAFNADVWRSDKRAVLVTGALLGERGTQPQALSIELMGAGRSIPLDLTVAGAGGPGTGMACDGCIVMRRDLADDILPGYRGLVSSFIVRVEDPRTAPAVAKRIDALLENESYPTRTVDFRGTALKTAGSVVSVERLVMAVLVVTLAALLAMVGIAAWLLSIRWRDILALLQCFGVTKLTIVSSLAKRMIAMCALAAGAGWSLVALAHGLYPTMTTGVLDPFSTGQPAARLSPRRLRWWSQWLVRRSRCGARQRR